VVCAYGPRLRTWLYCSLLAGGLRCCGPGTLHEVVVSAPDEAVPAQRRASAPLLRVPVRWRHSCEDHGRRRRCRLRESDKRSVCGVGLGCGGGVCVDGRLSRTGTAGRGRWGVRVGSLCFRIASLDCRVSAQLRGRGGLNRCERAPGMSFGDAGAAKERGPSPQGADASGQGECGGKGSRVRLVRSCGAPGPPRRPPPAWGRDYVDPWSVVVRGRWGLARVARSGSQRASGGAVVFGIPGDSLGGLLMTTDTCSL